MPPSSPDPLRISVVVATRNRSACLHRLLASLETQEQPLHEVLVVDASDRAADGDALRVRHPRLPIRVLAAPPSVCAQRNAGITAATGTHVFLCDDDMEVTPRYLPTLAAHLVRYPDTGALTGLISEPDERGMYASDFHVLPLRTLLWNTVFQLTVWADVSRTPMPSLLRRPLLAWYARRDNTFTLAGWPLVTEVSEPVIRCAVFGLGASLIARSWLRDAPYDEALGPHGIGDNYGVALGFPGDRPVVVLRNATILHHKVPGNRLPASSAHVLRILAMRRFRKQHGLYTPWAAAWLLWSLLGNGIRFLLRGNMAMLHATLATAGMLLFSPDDEEILRSERPFA
jgi:glycosyltransferase involved in cell wall biosynthesis